MGYDEKLIKELEDKAQKLRRDVVISIGVGVAGHIGSWNPRCGRPHRGFQLLGRYCGCAVFP